MIVLLLTNDGGADAGAILVLVLLPPNRLRILCVVFTGAARGAAPSNPENRSSDCDEPPRSVI